MKQIFQNNGIAHKTLFETVLGDARLQESIDSAAKEICACLSAGGKLLLCGNGGSAADAMHITAEFAAGFQKHDKPLAALSLNTNTAVLTAVSNDSAYRFVFAKQIEALANAGDVLLVLTTSGKSENVIEALRAAKAKGVKTITLCGENTREILSEHVIAVPGTETPRIQEMHMFIGHCLAQYAEEFFSDGESDE